MELLTETHDKYKQWLWQKSGNDSFAMKSLRTILQIISAILDDLKQGQLSLRAMSLVYTTIISLVPLFAISFSVLKGLGAHNQIRPFLLNALDALGEKKFEITDKILGFVDNIQVGVLGAVGIAVLIYTVIGMMQKIEFSFNYVWNVSKSRSFAKRINDYLSVLFVAPLLVFISTALTTSARSNYVIDKISNFYGFDLLITLIGLVIPYLILTLAFTFLYRFIPNTKVSLKAAFIGGLMTALIWKIMGWGFANFIADSANHAAVYSAFATIIVFMVWIYLVWLVLLIGASIGFYVQFPEYRKISHNAISLSTEYKECISIQIMLEVAKRFNNHQPPANTDDLSKLFRQPQNAIEKVCNYLKGANIIINEEENNAWVPSVPLSHISLYDIIKATRKNSTESSLALNEKDAKNYLKDIDKTLSDNFKSKNLQDMIE